MKRPLLGVALLYVAGILIGDQFSVSPFVLLGIAVPLAALATFWGSVRRWLLLTLILLVGSTNLRLQTAIVSPCDLRRLAGEAPVIATVRGTVLETPTIRSYQQRDQLSWSAQTRLEVAGWQCGTNSWVPATGRIVVTTPVLLTNVFAGQVVEVTGVVALPSLAAAEGTFDHRSFLRQQGIYYQLKALAESDWTILSSPSKRPLPDRFRDWARGALSRGLPIEDESVRLEWALTLGWKPALTEEVSEPFIQAATYHIFAVDGLRMAIIFGIFFGLFRAFGIPRQLGGLVLLPLLWFYVALTGWPASAIRACVMLTIVILGWVLKRPSDVFNSLLTAALLILLSEPRQLFQAGFQLSFFVVLCLILIVPPFHQLFQRLTAPDPWLPEALRRHWPRYVQVPARYSLDVLLTSFAAWIGSIPLVAYYFHIVTPVSTPANLVAVPLCGLVLLSNIAALLLTGWFPAAGELFNHAGWFLMECIRVSSSWFAHWPKAYVYTTAPSLFTCLLYYGVMLSAVSGWLFRPARRAWKFAGLAAALLLWGWQCWQAASLTRITVLAVNGGTAIFCDAPGSARDILIDAGTTNAVHFTLKPFLRAQGVNRLPTLLLTHGDLHHVGGAQMLADCFCVKSVCASPARFRSVTYRRTIEHFKQGAVQLGFVSRETTVAGWTVLHPAANDRYARADDAAVVLRREFQGTRVLLLSDLGRPGQDALLARTADLRADVVIAGLPSTGEPLCDALLDAIQPRLVIVADSEFPVTEQASPKLRERLARRHVPILYTRFSGTTTLELGSGWEARTMKGERITSRGEGQDRGPTVLPPQSGVSSGEDAGEE
jgi:competence protein ComEC